MKARGLSANRKGQRKQRNRKGIGKEWYSRKLYWRGQPFITFMRTAGHRETELMHEKINELVPEPAKTTALEIGPGTNPLLSEFPFRERIFMDISMAIARNLKTGRGAQVIVGDIRKIPFAKRKENFGVTVINEVLTHIKPSERARTVAEIAGVSDALLIIDREQVSINELANRERRNTKEKLNILAGTDTRSATRTRKEIKENLGSKLTNQALRIEQARLINFKPIEIILRKQGWQIQKQHIKTGDTTYTVLSAKRK